MSHHVQKHYDSRQHQNFYQRSKDKLFKLRKANNFIKTFLFKFVYGILNQPQKLKILDLACGKGGDLFKWASLGSQNKTKKIYTGIDISGLSLQEATRRVETIDPQLNLTATFHQIDLTKNIVSLPDHDIVSIQFAMHYFWESEETFMNLIDTVRTSLRKGGIFIVTCPNETKIQKAFSQKIENPFRVINLHETDSVFGNSYNFTLGKSVENCKEYLVNLEYFKKYMFSQGFYLPFHKSFPRIDQSINLPRWMYPAFDLYDAYIFQKK